MKDAALAFHVTMRLENDHGVARTVPTLRRATRWLTRFGKGFGMLAHRIADTHLHVLVRCNRKQAGKFARYAESGLRQLLKLPVPFEAARIRPIETARHLLNALRYLLRQEEHHHSDFDAAHDGSSLPDLLGMRELHAGGPQWLRELLPRLRREDILAWIGAKELDNIEPDLALGAEAVLAYTALESFNGTSAEHRRARHLLAQLWKELPTSSSTQVLGVSERTTQRLRALPLPPRVEAGLRLQLRWRTMLAIKASMKVDPTTFS